MPLMTMARRARISAGRVKRTILMTLWNDRVGRAVSKALPYRFDPNRYSEPFMRGPRTSASTVETVPRRVFALWTGNNPLTPNRARNLDRMKQILGVELILVTPENLSDWVVDGHPLHPAYENLALIHRSDYLRCYLMHHHGGGYCDIKEPLHSWGQVFDVFTDPEVWWAGSPELSPWTVSFVPGRLGRELRHHFAKMTMTSLMIARPRTPLTRELLEEVERRLDVLAPVLHGQNNGVFDEVEGYTRRVKWTSLLGDVLHPLELKYRDHVVLDRRLEVSIENYR